jgi:hypothetical protein
MVPSPRRRLRDPTRSGEGDLAVSPPRFTPRRRFARRGLPLWASPCSRCFRPRRPVKGFEALAHAFRSARRRRSISTTRHDAWSHPVKIPLLARLFERARSHVAVSTPCEVRTRLRAVTDAIRKRSVWTGRFLRVEGRRHLGGPPPAQRVSDASWSPARGAGTRRRTRRARVGRDPSPERTCPRRLMRERWIEAPSIVQA